MLGGGRVPRACPQVGISWPQEVSRVLGSVQPRNKEGSLEEAESKLTPTVRTFGWEQMG